MCGRFTQTGELADLKERFGFSGGEGVYPGPRYNLAPGQQALAVMGGPVREAVLLKWGLVPAWARDKKIGYRTINARAETVAEKPAFKKAFKRSRCLIPADGFYEWQSVGKGRARQPHYFSLRGGGWFAMAGIWDTWRDPYGETIKSFSIITTSANTLLAGIHERMPVMLPRELEQAWLDPDLNQAEPLLKVLKPYPAELMRGHAVSSLVNSVKNESPDLLSPAEVQAGLFDSPA